MEQQWKKQHPSQHQHPTVGILFTMHHPEKKQYVAVKAFPNTFEKGKNEFNSFIEKLKGKYAKKEEETKLEHFQNEISEAFHHFKKAFTKP